MRTYRAWTEPNVSRRRVVLGLTSALCAVLLVLFACGGEVTVTYPGCEECPGRCLKTSSGRERCVQCLKDEQCQSKVSKTKRCVNNRCTCGSDGDCPNDSVCSPKNGCVECLKDEHCGKDKPHCVEKICSVCKPAAIRACTPEGFEVCAKGQQTCRTSGSWGECKKFLVCQDGERCVKSKCHPSCPEPAPCKNGEKICLTPPNIYPGRYKECTKDNKECNVLGSIEKYCGAQEVCNKGQCTPFSCATPACKEGESRCIGEGHYQLCGRNKNGCIIWLPNTPCSPNEKCRPQVGKCTICKPGEQEECYTGDPKLKGSGSCKAGKKTCKVDGSGYGGCKDEVLPKTEVCNGKDDDCDGAVDEEFSTIGDPCEAGIGSCKRKGKIICKANGLGVECGVKGSSPKPEVCNGLDDDCDGMIDNVPNTKDRMTRSCYTGPTGTKNIGVCKSGTQTCKGAKWEDCKNEVKPTPEICDKIDNNCDGKVDNAQPEICNGKDDNCDGKIDEGLATIRFYPDTDNDGFGDVGGRFIEKCKAQQPTGYVANNKDCNDTVRTIKPGAKEICDGKDNNCDGKVDEGLTLHNWYRDSDKDGYGTRTVAFRGCNQNSTTVCTGLNACRSTSGYVTRTGDCCDLDPLARPGQTQYFYTANRCGNFDYNCDGRSSTNSRTCACSKTTRYTHSGNAYYYKNSSRYSWGLSGLGTHTYTNSTSCSLALTSTLTPSGNRSLSENRCCYSCKTVLGIKVSCGNVLCIKKSYCNASVTMYASRGLRSWRPLTSDNKQLVMWRKSAYSSNCIYHLNGTVPKCGEEGYRANSLENSSRLSRSWNEAFYNGSTNCHGKCSFSYRATLSYSFSLDRNTYTYSKPSSTKVKVLCR